MPTPLTRHHLDLQRHLQPYKQATTTRPDGTSWPRWRDTWKNASGYVQALARGGTGKTMSHVARHMDARRQRVEAFIRESPWDPDAVEEELNQDPPAAFEGPDAVLNLDGMGIPRKGDHTVGVDRQWCGATGKVDNCQVVVNLTLARPGAQRNKDQITWPLGTRLYLPEEWAGVEDAYDSTREHETYAQLRERARVPEDVAFASKAEIGLDLIQRAREAGIQHRCILADANFGRDTSFRKQLRDWGAPYAVGVRPSGLRVVPAEVPIEEPGSTEGRGPPTKHPRYPEEREALSPEDLFEEVEAEDAWEEVTFAEGAKGPLSGLYYRKRVRTVRTVQHRWVSDEVAWLVLEKRPAQDERRAYMCWGLDQQTGAPGDEAPEALSLRELVEVVHRRWTIERFHQDIKDTLGAEEFQGRTWGGFHRHMAMVLLAHAFIARLRVGADGAGEGVGLPSFEEVVRWVTWERGVQALVRDEGVERGVAEGLVDRLEREWFP